MEKYIYFWPPLLIGCVWQCNVELTEKKHRHTRERESDEGGGNGGVG